MSQSRHGYRLSVVNYAYPCYALKESSYVSQHHAAYKQIDIWQTEIQNWLIAEVCIVYISVHWLIDTLTHYRESSVIRSRAQTEVYSTALFHYSVCAKYHTGLLQQLGFHSNGISIVSHCNSA